MNQVD